MIFVTGDCHADFRKFNTERFPRQKEMTKDDYVIICGDFGGVWSFTGETPEEKYWLNWLNNKPFTTLFVDGNHENFDRLLSNEFPEVDFGGSKAKKIRDSVLYLQRGNIYEIDGCKILALGGARSHDIDDGIINISDYDNENDLKKDLITRFKRGDLFRVNHVSWWADEQPNKEKQEDILNKLKNNNQRIDFVISHCAPRSIVVPFLHGEIDPEDITEPFLEEVKNNIEFGHWYFGHYHLDVNPMHCDDRFSLLYDRIIQIK